MFYSYLVYFSLLSLLLFLAYIGKFEKQVTDKSSDDTKYLIISLLSIIIYSLIIGFRYQTGGDFEGYLSYYRDINNFTYSNHTHIEIGYFLLMKILSFLNLPFPALFVTSCIIQFTFLFKWASHYRFNLFWLVYFIFTSLFIFETMNIIRQSIAFCILLYATIFIEKRNFIKFLFFVLLGFVFHKSSIVFLIFYFILNNKLFINNIILFSLIVFSSILSFFVFEQLIQSVDLFAALLNYEGYDNLSNRDDLVFQDSKIGVAFFMNLIVNFIIIMYSSKIRSSKVFKGFDIYYNLFSISAILGPIVTSSNSIVISRVFFYFNSFKMILLSFLCYYLFSISLNMKDKIIGSLIVIYYFIWFLSAINSKAANCAPFYFYFQKIEVINFL